MALDLYDELVATAVFLNAAKRRVDPTTVTFRVRSPAGVETAYVYGSSEALANPSTGVYRLTFTPNAPGAWVVRAEGAGGVNQKKEMAFAVSASAFSTAA